MNDLENRFFQNFQKGSPESCWLWTGSNNGHYGRLYDKTICIETWAHRISWTIYNGPIPSGMQVCHNCPGGDNPLCVNPAHLFLGTQAINMADKVSKGRQQKGSQIVQAVLTEGDAERLVADYSNGIPVSNLIKSYKISRQAIYNLLNGLTWTHIHTGANGPLRNPRKLDLAKAQQLRQSFARGDVTYKDLAIKYNTTSANVGKVIRGELWKATE